MTSSTISSPLTFAPHCPTDIDSAFFAKRKITSKLPELLPLIASPHPALANYHHLLLYNDEECLHHPQMLQWHGGQRQEVWSDPTDSHFQHVISKALDSKSYPKYYNTYLSLFNIMTHILSARFQDENFMQPVHALRQAVTWLFMTRAEDQTASMGSHLKWYVQAGALPHIPMFEDTVKLLARNSKFDVDNNVLAFRLVLPPETMLQLCEPILKMQNICAEKKPTTHIYIVLALTVGQHLAESYNFVWTNWSPAKLRLHWPPFKHRKASCELPVSNMFLKLYAYVGRFYPHWLTDPTPPAHSMWSSQSKMGDDIANYLTPYQVNDSIFSSYNEKISHRHLRRSFASILHLFSMSHAVITKLLLHNSKKAVANYIALYHVEHVEFIKHHLPNFEDFMPPGAYVNDVNKPKLFVPHVPAFSNNKKRKTDVPHDQPLISYFVSKDQPVSHSVL